MYCGTGQMKKCVNAIGSEKSHMGNGYQNVEWGRQEGTLRGWIGIRGINVNS